MRDSIKQAIGETVQDMVNAGLPTSFTKKEMDLLGIDIDIDSPTIESVPTQDNKNQR
ncbi:MAG: hypothetical protein MJK04_33900 [Psychrosphaera sp.]|nr:hypothetical protein [Psychrosphaera sp.]